MTSASSTTTVGPQLAQLSHPTGRLPGGPGRSWLRSRGARTLGGQLACIGVVLVLWQALVVSGVLSTDAVASPTATAHALGTLIPTSGFWSVLGDTLRSWAIGLVISLVIGLPVGLAVGASNLAYRMSRVTIDFLRTIPPVVLLPLALLIYGATEQMVLLLVVVGSVWPVILQAMYGVHQVDPVSRDVAAAYRLRRREMVFAVIVPSAAPFIATGIRIAATMSLLLVVGSELLGGAPGIGNSIAVAQQIPDVPTMYAYVVVAAALGVTLNVIVVRTEGKVLAWHSSHRHRDSA